MDNLPAGLKKQLMTAALVTLVLMALYLVYYFIGPAIGEIIKYLIPIVLPFVMAVILASLIDPIVRYLQQKGKLNRTLAVISTMTFFLVIIGTITVAIISRLIVELEKLSKALPKYSVILGAQGLHLQQQLQTWYLDIELPDQVMEQLQGSLESLIELLKVTTTNTIDLLLTILAGVPGGLLITIIAILATYFFSRDKEQIMANFFKMLPVHWEEKLRSIFGELERAIIGFLRAQLFLISVTAVQTIVILYILNIDYAFTMGLVVGLVDILPVLGPGAVFIPWVVIEFLLGEKKLAFYLLLLYGSVVVVRQLLQPKVIGEQVGIHPLSALVAMYVGLKIMGVWGVIIGPMLLVLLKAMNRAGAFSRWL